MMESDERVVPGLGFYVCGLYVCKRIHDTGFIQRGATLKKM